MKNYRQGLHANVYRSADSRYDCTAGGLSSKFATVTVTTTDDPPRMVDGYTMHENLGDLEGPFTPSADAPEVRIVRRFPGGDPYLTAYVVDPTTGEPMTDGAMFGGNYVATSDSRMPGRYPVPIHDRFEHGPNRADQVIKWWFDRKTAAERGLVLADVAPASLEEDWTVGDLADEDEPVDLKTVLL